MGAKKTPKKGAKALAKGAVRRVETAKATANRADAPRKRGAAAGAPVQPAPKAGKAPAAKVRAPKAARTPGKNGKASAPVQAAPKAGKAPAAATVAPAVARPKASSSPAKGAKASAPVQGAPKGRKAPAPEVRAPEAAKNSGKKGKSDAPVQAAPNAGKVPVVAAAAQEIAGTAAKKGGAKRGVRASAKETPGLAASAPRPPLEGIDGRTMGKLEKMASAVLAQLDSTGQPFLTMRHRSLSNVAYNERRGIIELGTKTLSREFFNINMAKKFMQSFIVANGVKTLLEEGKTISIRQMFYMSKHTIKGTHENTFEDQSESDPIIEDLEVTVDALREELHLFANRRGLVVGRLVVNDAGDAIDLARMGRGGWGIPSICEKEHLAFVRTEAKFILLVEKQAIFHRLNEDRFWEKHDCILMTSEGQAARGARRLLQRMATELALPIYVLVDNDPWGLYIYSVLKQGSINLAFESMRLAVPGVRFLGMSAFDYDKFKLTPAATIKLTKEDIARAEQMLAYPWFKHERWQREIAKLLSNGFKMEVDALLTKSISFVTEEYIPRKLRERDWLA